MWASSDEIKQSVAKEIKKRLDRYYATSTEDKRQFGINEVDLYLFAIFRAVFDEVDRYELPSSGEFNWPALSATISHLVATSSERMVKSGYYRTRFTSDLVGEFIRSVKVSIDKNSLVMSRAYLDIEAFKRVELLKNFAFQSLIMSPRLKVAEHRGKDIVKAIFHALEGDEGYLLMPEDFQQLYREIADGAEKKRVICDFIAGMTDRYAVQFYGRLFGTNPESVFSPL